MSFEVTYNCDICGNVGGAASTHRKAILEAKTEGFLVIRVDGHLRCVCSRCTREGGGSNDVRRTLRYAAKMLKGGGNVSAH